MDFHVPSGELLYLDHGYIRIAALAGFIRPLAADAVGVVSTIRLAWTV